MASSSLIKKLQFFFHKFRKINFKKGDMIIRAGDVPPGIYYVRKGNVRMYSVSEAGTEVTLNIFKPGTFFSLIWALGEIPNTYFFEAITPVETHLAPKREVIKFLRKESSVLFDTTRRAFIGLYGISTRLESLVSGDAYAKIASTLVISAKRFGQNPRDNELVINLPLTHSDIAILSGTTRETASRQIKKLERKGVIERKGKIFLVKDLSILEKEALLSPTP